MSHERQIKRILVIVVFCTVLLCGAYYVVFRQVRQMNERASALENQATFEGKKQQYFISMDRAVQNLQEDISHIDESFVASDGDVEFIEYLESLGRESGITASIDSLTIDPDESLAKEGLEVFTIHLKATGTWTGTYTFLSRLESSQFKIKIDRLALVHTGGDGPVDTKKGSAPVSIWNSSFEIHVLKYKK